MHLSISRTICRPREIAVLGLTGWLAAASTLGGCAGNEPKRPEAWSPSWSPSQSSGRSSRTLSTLDLPEAPETPTNPYAVRQRSMSELSRSRLAAIRAAQAGTSLDSGTGSLAGLGNIAGIDPEDIDAANTAESFALAMAQAQANLAASDPEFAAAMQSALSGSSNFGPAIGAGLGTGEAVVAEARPENALAPEATSAADRAAWTIVLASFIDTPDAEPRVVEAIDLMRRAGLAGLSPRAERRGNRIAVVAGRYRSAEDAAPDLARIRNLEFDGRKRFALAITSPPDVGQLVGSRPEYDLRQAKVFYDLPDPAYTLQVGVYGSADGASLSDNELAEVRRTAEQAAYDLRRQGELAFYFHGASRSSLTIGIWGPNDHSPQQSGQAIESSALIAARQRFPQNTLNGGGIVQRLRQRDGDSIDVLQESFLVSVPR